MACAARQAQAKNSSRAAFAPSFLPSSSPFFPFGPSEPLASLADGEDSILVLHSPKELLAYRNARPAVPLRVPAAVDGRDLDEATAENGVSTVGKATCCSISRRRRISLVPTMGGLHEGHMHLVRSASRIADEVWVTIFLNSFQFQSPEDFYSYPASVDDDLKVLSTEPSVRVVFIPSHQSLYPLDAGHTFALGHSSWVQGGRVPDRPGEEKSKRAENNTNGCHAACLEGKEVEDTKPTNEKSVNCDETSHETSTTTSGRSQTTQRLFRMRVDFEDVEEVEGEGRRRPGFFRGIGTVVSQLLTLTRPTYAHFGLKDFQQVACIKRLICGMGAGTILLAHSTSRDPDGLATASRNLRLNTDERRHVQKGYQLLQRIGQLYAGGERRVKKLLQEGWSFAKAENLHTYYITVDRWEDAEPVLYRCGQGNRKRFTWGIAEANSGNKRARTGNEECRNATLTPDFDKKDKTEENDLTLDSPGRFCVTVAVRGNHLTTIVDNICLSDFPKHGDLLPPPMNTPWKATSSEFKYASFSSFVLLMSLGFHLRRLSKGDSDLLLRAEAADELFTQSQRACKIAGTNGEVPEQKVSNLPWLCDGASKADDHTEAWALGLFKRSLDCKRTPGVAKSEEVNGLSSLSERLIGYVWGDVQGGEKPVLFLRRVFVERSRRRQTLGTHLLRAYLAISYKEKMPSLGSKLVVRTDPLPLWLAHAAFEHGFSITGGDSSKTAAGQVVVKDSFCQMQLNLEDWYTRFVE